MTKAANSSNFSGKFFVGQEVESRFIGNSSVKLQGKITKLTKCFAWVNVSGQGVKRCKIKMYDGVEYILPLGDYSMAPRFKAT